jgi:hypothetical protein
MMKNWHSLTVEEFQVYGERSQLALINVCLTIANETDPRPNSTIASTRQRKATEILNSISGPFSVDKFNPHTYRFMEAALARYGVSVRNETPAQLTEKFAALFNAFAGVNPTNANLHRPVTTPTTPQSSA